MSLQLEDVSLNPCERRHGEDCLDGVRCLLVEPDAERQSRPFRAAGAHVTETGTIGSALFHLENDMWDLVVVDLRLPDGHGKHVAEAARRSSRRPAIVLFSAHRDLLGSPEVHALGDVVVTKLETTEYLVPLARAALAETRRLGPPVQSRNGDLEPWTSGFARARALSPRQRQTLSMLAAGMNPKIIATELGISETTFRFHARATYRKCGVRNQRELLALLARSMASV